MRIVILALLLAACTTNPLNPTQTASDIANAFCTHLESCGDEPDDPATHYQCVLGTRTNLLTPPPAGAWTLAIDDQALETCLNKIQDLDCTQEWLPPVCFKALWSTPKP